MYQVVKVEPKPDYSLSVQFNDGLSGEISIEKIIEGPIFQPLKQVDYFNKVNIDSFGGVCWPNGADLAPDVIHSLVEQNLNYETGVEMGIELGMDVDVEVVKSEDTELIINHIKNLDPEHITVINRDECIEIIDNVNNKKHEFTEQKPITVPALEKIIMEAQDYLENEERLVHIAVAEKLRLIYEAQIRAAIGG